MAAVIHRLRTRPQRLREDQAELVRDAIGALPELPEQAASELLTALDRITAPATDAWTFAMIDPTAFAAVVDQLAATAPRPMIAVRLWTHLFAHLDRRSGEVLLTRDEMAAQVGAPARDISRVLSALVALGAISRRRERGGVRVFLNPLVGTHTAGLQRAKAQAEAPVLRLVPAT